MKVLVMGGNGFIGSHLSKMLHEQGHEVLVFDLDNSRVSDIPGIKFLKGNFNAELNILDGELRDTDLVVHSISTTVPSTSGMNSIQPIQGDLYPTLQLIDKMLSNQVYKMVFLSSGGTVYGNAQHSPISEEHALDPVSSYGMIKKTIESYLKYYEQNFGLEPLIVRPSNPYGPGQNYLGNQGVVSKFLYSIVSGHPIEVWGDGKNRKDYLYIGDLARILTSMIGQYEKGTYNIGYGQDTSLLEIISTIEDVTGIKANVNFIPAKTFDVKNVCLDIRKIKNDFGVAPETDLNKGIDRYYQWLKTDLQRIQ